MISELPLKAAHVNGTTACVDAGDRHLTMKVEPTGDSVCGIPVFKMASAISVTKEAFGDSVEALLIWPKFRKPWTAFRPRRKRRRS